jgi:ATP-dependent RNA circularization protein (DNA/RNA ligase family)
LLEQIQNRPLVITRKEDGTSVTFAIKNGVYFVCSRNRIVQEDESCEYNTISQTLKIKDKLISLNRDLGIQGEICGPKINRNRTLCKSLSFSVFNIFDIAEQRYLLHEEVESLCHRLSLPMVPLIYKGNASDLFLIASKYKGVFDKSSFLTMASDLEYQPGFPAEGMVVKTNDDPDRRVSFKVISNRYLLKHDL